MGALQLPISNVAVMAQSHFSLTGAATAIGEQPLKGLINPAAMARLCLGEALTNLVWAQSTGLADIKASVNWMYAAKMASEGVAMYEAATALKEAMVELQVLTLTTLFLPGGWFVALGHLALLVLGPVQGVRAPPVLPRQVMLD